MANYRVDVNRVTVARVTRLPDPPVEKTGCLEMIGNVFGVLVGIAFWGGVIYGLMCLFG